MIQNEFEMVFFGTKIDLEPGKVAPFLAVVRRDAALPLQKVQERIPANASIPTLVAVSVFHDDVAINRRLAVADAADQFSE